MELAIKWKGNDFRVLGPAHREAPLADKAPRALGDCSSLTT